MTRIGPKFIGAGELRKLESGIARAQRRLDSIAGGFTRVGTALTGIATGTVTAFAVQEAKWSELAAKTGESVEDLRSQYGAAAKSISNDTGIALTSILDGFQKAISAGTKGEGAIRLVGEAAKAEAANITSLQEAISAATTAAVAFGTDPVEAVNKMIRAAQVGEGDTEDYATSIKGLLQTAKPTGVAFGELAGTLAATAQQAKTVAVAETQINAFLKAIVDPTDAARKDLKAISGGLLSFEQVQRQLKTDGLAAVVQTLQTMTGMDATKIAQLFPEVEAQRFFNTADPATIRQLTTEVEAGAEAIPKAFAEGADDIQRLFNRTRETVKNVVADIGQTLKPEFKAINQLVQDFVGWFESLGPEAKRIVGRILALGPVLIGLGFLAKALSIILGALSVPWAAISAGGVATFGAIKGAAVAAFTTIRGLTLSGLWARIVAAGTATFGAIKAAGIGAFTAIQARAAAVIAAIKGLTLAGLWASLKAGAGVAVGAIVGAVKAIAVGALGVLTTVGLPVLAVILAIVALAAALIAAWKPVSTFLVGMWTGIKDNIGLVGEAFGRLLDALGPVGGAVRGVFGWLADLLPDLSAEGESFGKFLVDALVAVIEAVTAVITFFDGLTLENVGRRLMETLVTGIKATAGLAKDAVVSVLSGVRDLLPFSDAREGPLSRLTHSGRAIVTTLAEGVRSAPAAVQDSLRVALPNLDPLALPNLDPLALPNLDPLALPNLDAIAPPLPVGPVPPPAQAAGTTLTVNLAEGAIVIHAPGGDAEAIATRIGGELQSQWRALAEQVDSRVKA